MPNINEIPTLDPEEKEFIEKVTMRYSECRDHSKDWRDEALTSYDYVSGDQWSDDDKAEMEDMLRPWITFNRTEVFVSAVTGLETLNRQEVQIIPRKTGPVGNAQSELWTQAIDYVNDDSDTEVHDSHAFKDMVICGMGWTETRTDYEQNPEGDIKVERLDPIRGYWDVSATQRNLKDAKWVMYIYPMTLEDIKAEWPDKADEIRFTKMFDPDFEETRSPHNASEAWKYETDQTRRQPRMEDELYVVKYQWYETERFYRVKDPQGMTKEFTSKEWNRFKDRHGDFIDYLTQSGRVIGPFPKRQYKQAIIAGWTKLEEIDLITDDFTLQCMTGKYDRNNNIWYGLVRGLFDPQDWINKLYSEILYIINSNAKGGLLAEKDAFDSPQQAENDWAHPAKIVWTRQGAIANGKIQQRTPPPYPQGLNNLLQFASQMFTEVTGANVELLGLAEKVQPGVLEAQRKQAGMTILAWAFDALRYYRKRHGRILATYVREFLADGRLIRISGPKGQQYIPLIRDELALEYDVIVQDSPTSTNERERTFAILMQLMPSLIQMGAMPPPSVLDYMPLPQAMIEEWKQSLNNPQAQQAQDMQKQIAQAAAQADIQETQSKTAKNQAAAQLDQVRAKTEPFKAVK